MRPKPTKEQFKGYYKSHVQDDTQSDCHLWTAARNNIGYGMFRYNGKMCTAHRVMMEWEGHNIKGKIVYHTCDNYHCVNPAHLRVGTIKDKAEMMTSKGRSGRACKDKTLYRTCIYCGFFGSAPVIGHSHNEQCKHKPG